MGALVSILQSDPNLLRCQLARLKDHVSLQEDETLPDAYGFGYYHAGSVLLGKRPTGAQAPLALTDVVGGKIDSEAVLVHARRSARRRTRTPTRSGTTGGCSRTPARSRRSTR
jgi:hypothetical protein